MVIFKHFGQATVEYIFVLAFVVFLAFNVTNKFSDFFKNSMGTVGHALSTNLIVGVCPNECFFEGYENSYQK